MTSVTAIKPKTPVSAQAIRAALIDKLCSKLGTQYAGLKQYRAL